MKFTKVNDLPGRKGKKRVRAFLEEFMTRNVEIARVDLHEDDYKSPAVARRCLCISAQRACLPVKACYRGNKVYLYRTDM